jgi:hypothetical protein
MQQTKLCQTLNNEVVNLTHIWIAPGDTYLSRLRIMSTNFMGLPSGNRKKKIQHFILLSGLNSCRPTSSLKFLRTLFYPTNRNSDNEIWYWSIQVALKRPFRIQKFQVAGPKGKKTMKTKSPYNQHDWKQ